MKQPTRTSFPAKYLVVGGIILLGILYIVYLFMGHKSRKMCLTTKQNKRICVKSPSMSAEQVITLQMNALQKTRKRDISGIRVAYEYASLKNRENTGPFPRFKEMVRNKIYRHLLGCHRWSYVKHSVQKQR